MEEKNFQVEFDVKYLTFFFFFFGYITDKMVSLIGYFST